MNAETISLAAVATSVGCPPDEAWRIATEVSEMSEVAEAKFRIAHRMAMEDAWRGREGSKVG